MTYLQKVQDAKGRAIEELYNIVRSGGEYYNLNYYQKRRVETLGTFLALSEDSPSALVFAEAIGLTIEKKFLFLKDLAPGDQFYFAETKNPYKHVVMHAASFECREYNDPTVARKTGIHVMRMDTYCGFFAHESVRVRRADD